MPDSSLPSSTPKAPDELNLDTPVVEKPRLKRRSLKTASESTAAEPRSDSPRPEPFSREPIPSHPTAATPTSNAPPLYYTTGARKDAPMNPNPASSPAMRSTPAAQVPTQPVTAAAQPASSMRPTGSPAAPSYSNPTAASSRPAGSTGTPSTSHHNPAVAASTPRPAASTGAPPRAAASSSSLAPALAAPVRAASVNDYRANVERQTREQKSVGGAISMVVYVLVGLFLVGGLLAGYGSYVIFKQIHQQSLTLTDLDNRYTAQNQALSAQLKAFNDSLTEALTQTQAQLSRQQELVTREQDSINRLVTASDSNAAAWRQERQSRAAEEASLRIRVRNLEDQPRLNPER